MEFISPRTGSSLQMSLTNILWFLTAISFGVSGVISSLHPSKQDENGLSLCSDKPVQCLYIIGLLFFVNAIHDFVVRMSDLSVLAFPLAYKNVCVGVFSLECIVMLLANALIVFDECSNPTNLQKTLAVFVLALDFGFLFVIVSIYVVGLDSSELLQRHFGIIGFVAIHQLGINMQALASPRG